MAQRDTAKEKYCFQPFEWPVLDLHGDTAVIRLAYCINRRKASKGGSILPLSLVGDYHRRGNCKSCFSSVDSNTINFNIFVLFAPYNPPSLSCACLDARAYFCFS